MTGRDAPSSLRSLEDRIRNVARARGTVVRRIQRVVANTVVGQMLPPGVVKGGTAMQVRLGEGASRFTPDLDASRAKSLPLDEYITALEAGLAAGWGGFTGTVEMIAPRTPEGVPADYVMQPFDVRLAYESRQWLTVSFELGRDEVGSTEVVAYRLAADIRGIFSAIGLPEPAPLPLIAVEHQVAQKLHACTFVSPKTGRNDRAHDLVDLQLLAEDESPIDMAALNAIGARLFDARRLHAWPPTVGTYDGWPETYAAAAEGLDVLDDVQDAVAWANALIADAAATGG